jgi:HK97 gp10 family phage protein
MEFEIVANNADLVKVEFEKKVQNALESAGGLVDDYAKSLCPVDTGNLRNSITHEVEDTTAWIGTDNEYAIYVECGTGIYYPGGRQTPWVFQDSKGNWHLTHGQRAQEFLKPAIADHTDQIQSIIEKTLNSG